MTTFQTLTQELYEVLQFMSTDLQEAHLREAGLLDMREQLLQTDEKLKNILSSGIVVKMKILQSQLDAQKQKLSQLEEETKKKESDNRSHLISLKAQYKDEILPGLKANEERIENELLNGTIKSYDYQINELKKEFQGEVEAIDLEYSLLSAHINRYMESMLIALNENM